MLAANLRTGVNSVVQFPHYSGERIERFAPRLSCEMRPTQLIADPLKIRLPRGRELEGRGLVEFKRQREQVDELMSHSVASASLSQRAELR